MNKKNILYIAVMCMLFVFSACGGKEEPEDGWLARLNKLATETIIESSEENGIMVEKGELEIVIDKLYPGSFTKEGANEIFVNCWFKGLPHVGGLDSRAGILLNADTLEVITYKEFRDDEVMLSCPRTAKGQNRILCLSGSGAQGTRGQCISLWSVHDGMWERLPTGIGNCVGVDKKNSVPFAINETEYEINIHNGWCYMSESMESGTRLAVTCEYGLSDLFEPGAPPAELTAILVWNPHSECFELDNHTIQPKLQQAQPDKR